MGKFCEKCNVGCMEAHKELRWWVKCPICGFCKFDLDHIHPKDHETAKANPMLEYVMFHLKNIKTWIKK